MKIGSGTAIPRSGATATAILLLMTALATPVLGGGPTCSLQATVGGGSATEVETGEDVLIEGFGFPATVDVDLVYDVDGTVIGGETVTTDGAGLFETTVTPQPGEEGTWTVTASVVQGCIAETGFLVVAGPTPAPTPSPTPAPTPLESQLPNASTGSPSAPDGPNPEILAGIVALLAATWLSRRRLAHLVR
jgi:hypothetical protein